MWPFKRKKKKQQQLQSGLVAKKEGVVEKVMYDYLVVSGVKYSTKKPLVRLGQSVKKGQPVGK